MEDFELCLIGLNAPEEEEEGIERNVKRTILK